MGWLFLSLVIILEVSAMAIAKYSSTEGSFILYTTRYVLILIYHTILYFALRTIDVTLAYIIWSALGIVLITFVGVILFNEKINPIQYVCIILVIIGVVGLIYGNKLN